MCVLTFEATLVDLCGEGWIATGFGTCLKLIREQKDFHDAKNICVSHDAQLVTLHTRQRFNFLKGLIMKESKKYIIIIVILNNILNLVVHMLLHIAYI